MVRVKTLFGEANRKKSFFLTFSALILGLGVFVFSVSPVFAEGVDIGIEYAASSGLPDTPPIIIITNIINIILGLLGIITTVLIVYAGFLWLTSAGNEDKIDTAKQVISAAVIGLILVLSSYTISRFALRAVYKSTTGNNYPTPYLYNR